MWTCWWRQCCRSPGHWSAPQAGRRTETKFKEQVRCGSGYRQSSTFVGKRYEGLGLSCKHSKLKTEQWQREANTGKEIKTQLILNHCCWNKGCRSHCEKQLCTHYISPPVLKMLSLKLSVTWKENSPLPKKKLKHTWCWTDRGEWMNLKNSYFCTGIWVEKPISTTINSNWGM